MSVALTQVIFISITGLLAVILPIIFFQHRRAERVMRAMKDLLLDPSRIKVSDARVVVGDVLDGAISKIISTFNEMATVLSQQISRAEILGKKMGVENKLMVSTADIAAERISTMTRALDNLVGNLTEIVNNDQWKIILSAADGFNNGINGLLKELEIKSTAILDVSGQLNNSILEWSESGRRLNDELHQNIADGTDKINMMSIAAHGMNDELSALQNSVVSDFENVKLSSQGIENVLITNEKLLANQLEKMSNFTDQARKLLQQQVNTMADTANRVGTDIRLAEGAIDSGTDKLNETTEKLFVTSKTIKETFDILAREIMDIRAKFQTEIGEFSNKLIGDLKIAREETTKTMDSAGYIAAEFRDNLVPMLSDINGTVDGLDNARDKISELSGLVRDLGDVLPTLTDQSGDMNEKINAMTTSARDALAGIGDSTLALSKLTGESRQQMISLMDDYAKAVSTMRELNNSMAQARASAPMAAMANVGSEEKSSKVTVQDFVKSIDKMMEKLHDLSVDLTRSIGAEIPDSVMKKYNNGDRAIFSKWFAKMISAADKKRVKTMFKQDAVFRSQATQFVHGFAKMIAGAERTDNKDMVVVTLMKTDLGIMYQALKACL